MYTKKALPLFLNSLTLFFLMCLTTLVSAEYKEGQPLPTPGWPGHDLNGAPCNGRDQGYGPYDYTNPNHRGFNLRVVEIEHFTKEVENLTKGHRLPDPYSDLDYTIMAFPNHHRALYAMMRYQMKNPELASRRLRVECHFQRAIKFQPNDYRVMQLYANYLTKKKRSEMAVTVYKKALNIPSAPAIINYTLGLLYFDMKKFDDAVEQAEIAYDGGVKKSKLAKKLKSINLWPAE